MPAKVELSRYNSEKAGKIKAVISNAWENTKDEIEKAFDSIIAGEKKADELIQSTGEWWRDADLYKKVNQVTEQIGNNYKNSPISEYVTIAMLSRYLGSYANQTRWERSSLGRFVDNAQNSIAEFINEHETELYIIGAGIIIVACGAAICSVSAAEASVGASAASTTASPMAAAMADGAMFGATTLSMGGVVVGGTLHALDYYKKYGTVDGSTEYVLNGAAKGAYTGAEYGSDIGSVIGGFKYYKKLKKVAVAAHFKVCAENTVEAAGELSAGRIEFYLDKARKNSASDFAVLGCTGNYDVFASNKSYTYFQMSDELWATLEAEAGGNYDEIWKINQRFIDEQIVANKRILLSDNPYNGYYFEDGSRRFYQRELDYLTSKGFSFESTSDGMWMAIRR